MCFKYRCQSPLRYLFSLLSANFSLFTFPSSLFICLLLLFRPLWSWTNRSRCGIRPYASGKILGPQISGERVRAWEIISANRIGKRHAGKAAATGKSRPPNAGHAVGDGYAGQAGAKTKNRIPDDGHAVSYGYAGKAGAFDKSPFPDAGHAVGYGYAGKAAATGKSPKPNAGHAVGYGDAGKAAATDKSILPDAGHAVGYGYGARFSCRALNQGLSVLGIENAV